MASHSSYDEGGNSGSLEHLSPAAATQEPGPQDGNLLNSENREQMDREADQRDLVEHLVHLEDIGNLTAENQDTVKELRRFIQSVDYRLRNIEQSMMLQSSQNIPAPPQSSPLPPPQSLIQACHGNTSKANANNNDDQLPPLKQIPEIRPVVWDEFKSRDRDDNTIFAIDVLIGSPKYWFHRMDEEFGMHGLARRRKNNPHLMKPQSEQGNQLKEMPERIRINSVSLLSFLDDLAEERRDIRPRVYLQPYKPLLHYEDRIRAKLEAAKRDLMSRETAEECSQMPDGGDTTRNTEREVQGGPSAVARSVNTEGPTEVFNNIEALENLQCLVDFIDSYVTPFLPDFVSTEKRKVRFQHLWHLFKPGDHVFLKPNGPKSDERMRNAPPDRYRQEEERVGWYQIAWRVLQVKGGRPALRPRTMPGQTYQMNAPGIKRTQRSPFRCSMYYLDFDGEVIVPRSSEYIITYFDGERDITSLPFFPWRFVHDHEGLRDRLIQRGKEFLGYRDRQHRYHIGTTLTRSPDGYSARSIGSFGPFDPPPPPSDPSLRHEQYFEGEVIVDFQQTFREKPELRVRKIQQLLGTDLEEFHEDYDFTVWENRETGIVADEYPEIICNDDFVERLRSRAHMDSHPTFKGEMLESNTGEGEETESPALMLSRSTGDDLMLLPERVFGYNLKARKFQQFRTRNLGPVPEKLDGYDSLKLPGSTKELVRGLVQSHIMKPKACGPGPTDSIVDYDVVHGKGRGLILLLHGVPGVGKTSTAETVAQNLRMPLWPIVCGDLGTNSVSVDRSLSEICRLADHWNCVLLLDEADVFLAQRNDRDLEQNALVSVFLRQLEWFSGILFLTTNRVGVIDDAFKSRIHMTLYYPPLDLEQTIEIWKMNLERVKRIDESRTRGTENPSMVIQKEKILEYARRQFHKNEYGRGRWNGRQIRNAF